MDTYLVLLGTLVLLPGLVSMVFAGFLWDPRRDLRLARVSIQGRRAGDRA